MREENLAGYYAGKVTVFSGLYAKSNSHTVSKYRYLGSTLSQNSHKAARGASKTCSINMFINMYVKEIITGKNRLILDLNLGQGDAHP